MAHSGSSAEHDDKLYLQHSFRMLNKFVIVVQPLGNDKLSSFFYAKFFRNFDVLKS
jgi:hypothetical protein